MSNIYDVAIFHGHGEGDVGCQYGHYNELMLIKPVLELVVNGLREKGVSVYTNLESGLNNYNRDLLEGVKIKSKMAYELHFNDISGNDELVNGSLIISPINENFLDTEINLMTKLSSIGFNIRRGIKSRDYNTEQFMDRIAGVPCKGKDWYKVIRQAWDKQISLSIIEFGFIKNIEDVWRIRYRKIDIANAIIEQILTQVDVKEISKCPTCGREY